jgi:DNA helicase-2/ATP-dependent DNA helicase PcrA
MEEGLLPHQKSIDAPGAAIDEERRLCYVGVTRAKRRLTLTLSLSRQKWGKARPTIPSRFLYELIGQADNPNYAAAKAGKPHVPTRAAATSSTGSGSRRADGADRRPPRPPRR